MATKYEQEQLRDALEYASTVERTNPIVLEAVVESLNGAIVGIDRADEMDLVLRAEELVQDLQQSIRALQLARAVAEGEQLAQTISPCPCCRGRELLVARSTRTEMSIGYANVALAVELIVCRSCGDLRQRVDPRTLPTTFIPVTLPGDDSAYR